MLAQRVAEAAYAEAAKQRWSGLSEPAGPVPAVLRCVATLQH
jgi:hypothetical protein